MANSFVRRCQCQSHKHRHNDTIDLLSKQNEFNEIVTEETDNLRTQFSSKETQVCAIDVALNEKREEISRLEEEIRADQPEILQMTNSELRLLNDHLAEDLRILVRKFPTSPTPSQCIEQSEVQEVQAEIESMSGSFSSTPSTPSTPQTPGTPKTPGTPQTPTSSKSAKVTGFFKRQISKIDPRRSKNSRRSSNEVL